MHLFGMLAVFTPVGGEVEISFGDMTPDEKTREPVARLMLSADLAKDTPDHLMDVIKSDAIEVAKRTILFDSNGDAVTEDAVLWYVKIGNQWVRFTRWSNDYAWVIRVKALPSTDVEATWEWIKNEDDEIKISCATAEIEEFYKLQEAAKYCIFEGCDLDAIKGDVYCTGHRRQEDILACSACKALDVHNDGGSFCPKHTCPDCGINGDRRGGDWYCEKHA